jgi:PAS domain S-box-containing protein
MSTYAMFHSSQHLAAIVQSSDDAIVSKTLQGIVTSWNRGAERIFGYTSDEMIGRPITVLFPPDRLPEETEFLARIARGEHIEHFETVRVRKNGEPINISVTLSPLMDERGQIVGVSKIARDITERVKLVAREQAARKEAEAADRIKDEFLATLAHELRTPLNAVCGWVSMLRMKQLDAETHRHALEVIHRNCLKQLTLINDLLDMSRVVTGRVVLNPRMLDLRSVVDEAVESLAPMAADRRVLLRAAHESPIPAVIGDPERLQQVVWNLVSNAVKFSKAAGRVDVRLYVAGSRVHLTVTDDGIGIEPKVLPYIFDRFRQADSSTTRREGGLGLGLALVKHFVELHGGTVSATSPGKDRGATFTVTLAIAAVHLPNIAPSDHGDRPASQALAEQRLKGIRAVVVDDDRDSRDLICEVLRRAGANTLAAASATEALGTLVTERPDVLVTDLGMPGEDGFALVKRVRALPDPERSNIPALALTAYAGSADRQLALATGFNGFLAKPVRPDSLVDAVFRLVMGGNGRRRESRITVADLERVEVDRLQGDYVYRRSAVLSV